MIAACPKMQDLAQRRNLTNITCEGIGSVNHERNQGHTCNEDFDAPQENDGGRKRSSHASARHQHPRKLGKERS
jgi:hypothetical protein